MPQAKAALDLTDGWGGRDTMPLGPFAYLPGHVALKMMEGWGDARPSSGIFVFFVKFTLNPKP